MCLESCIDQQTHFLLKAYGFPAEHNVLLVPYVLFSRSEEARQTLPELLGQARCVSVCVCRPICFGQLKVIVFLVEERFQGLKEKHH